MHQTMEILNQQDNFLLADKVMNMPYTKQAIKEYKVSV